MLSGLADNTNPGSLASRMRRLRMRHFEELLASAPQPVTVLDVGGTIEFWQRNLPALLDSGCLTILNVHPPAHEASRRARIVVGDARDMREFPAGAFGVCFSNSMIEHVGDFGDQMAVAREVRRVGKAYFVQTPNRYFPIEPHFLFPFWQFLPVGLRVFLHGRTRLGWMPPERDPDLARSHVVNTRLLNAREMRELFPDARLVPERFVGMVKSWMAIRRWPCEK